MTLQEFLFNFGTVQVWFIARIFILISLSLYLIFAFMIIREVDLMNETIKGVFNLPIKIIAWIHLTFAIIVFLVALFYL